MSEVPEEICAGGVVLQSGRFLALRRRNGVWLLPKGHVDPGETLEQTAVREVNEETGLTVKLGPKLGETRYSHSEDGQMHRKHVHWYLMDAVAGEARPEEGLFTEVRWFEQSEIRRLTFEHDRALVRKAFILKTRGSNS
jgi:8-oxo-dGTP pyrophosphatase MutT (NUDIX family)